MLLKISYRLIETVFSCLPVLDSVLIDDLFTYSSDTQKLFEATTLPVKYRFHILEENLLLKLMYNY